MDFDVSQADGIHFIYVLPFDAHTALVESTFFTGRLLPEAVYEEAIDTWLARRRPGMVFETISNESGVIPMTTAPFDAWPSPRIVRIGTAGGHVKPSSGYAFLAVQRFVRVFAPRVVSALRAGECAEPPAARSPRTTALDTIFLSYLRSRPERAPDTFYRLFERVPPAVLARFLETAKAAADFYLEHTPTDGVPYWDTGAPGLAQMGDYLDRPAEPFNDHEPVDSSAAAISAQGLLRLGRWLENHGEPEAGKKYLAAGLTTAKTLFAEPYLSSDPNHEGLLLHSVYHRPNGWDHIPPGRKVPCGEATMWGDYHARELALYLLRLAGQGPYLTFYS
jgi:hypothetical protein